MGIFDKIDHIRQKPEHIRVRFVWLCVAISMVFVLIFWVISLKSQPQTTAPDEVITQDLKSQLDQQKQTLENIGKGYQNSKAQINDSAAQN